MEGHGTATIPAFASMNVDELHDFRSDGFSTRMINERVAPETREWVAAYVDALVEAIDQPS